MINTNEPFFFVLHYLRFLLQCLEDLDLNLRKLNSRLFVLRGQPTDVLPKIFRDWGCKIYAIITVKQCIYNVLIFLSEGTTCLTFEEDPEPFGKVRDNSVIELCKGLDIEVIQITSHTLYNLDT